MQETHHRKKNSLGLLIFLEYAGGEIDKKEQRILNFLSSVGQLNIVLLRHSVTVDFNNKNCICQSEQYRALEYNKKKTPFK